MSAGHRRGFPGFPWQNFMGVKAGSASTSPRLLARTAPVSKSPPTSSTEPQVSDSTSLAEQDLDFLPTQPQIKPWDGSILYTWPGTLGFGGICSFRLLDEQTRLKARDNPWLWHWKMFSQRVTPMPWAPRVPLRDVCSGSECFISLRATSLGGFPFTSAHHLSSQPKEQSGIN